MHQHPYTPTNTAMPTSKTVCVSLSARSHTPTHAHAHAHTRTPFHASGTADLLILKVQIFSKLLVACFLLLRHNEVLVCVFFDRLDGVPSKSRLNKVSA